MRVFLPAALLLSATLAAQPVREVTTVEVVEVPTYVTRDGKPVTGLTRENFTLFVNGQPQPVEYFDVIDFAGLSSEESRNPRQRRLYFLLFDLSSDPFALTRARRAVDAFVGEAHAADVFAVATLGRDGIHVVAPFTRDRAAMRHAVRNLKAETLDPLRLAFEVQAQETRQNPNDFPDDAVEPDDTLGGLMRDMQREPQRRRISGTIAQLDRLASQLAPLEGHKHVVLLSGGFDATLIISGDRSKKISDVRQGPVESLTAAITQKMRLRNDGPPQARGSIIQALARLTQRYAGASVFLDAIDIAGVRDTWDGGGRESLHLLARNGQVVANRNDLGQAMHYLSDIQRVVYVLGFRAQPTRKRENRIRVELVNVPRRATVTHRRSYSSVAANDPASDLFLADIVANDIPQNGLSIDVSAEGGTVSMTVPGRELLAFGGETVNAQALLYVFSGTRVVAFQGKNITIDTKRARSLEQQTYGVKHTFDLPPGTYTAKVLLRIDGQDARGFAKHDFVVQP